MNDEIKEALAAIKKQEEVKESVQTGLDLGEVNKKKDYEWPD